MKRKEINKMIRKKKILRRLKKKGKVDPTKDCPFMIEKPCDEIATVNTYRTIDGSCNNLKYPIFGKSFTPMRREQDASYADGKSIIIKTLM